MVGGAGWTGEILEGCNGERGEMREIEEVQEWPPMKGNEGGCVEGGGRNRGEGGGVREPGIGKPVWL